VVEVSESSLDRDRGIKLGIYRRGGIGQYWIVNVASQQVEVYSSEGAAGSPYGPPAVYGLADSVPVMIEGVERFRVAIRDLFVDD
jgi:hypothetical protein